jgi:hypothetical protein
MVGARKVMNEVGGKVPAQAAVVAVMSGVSLGEGRGEDGDRAQSERKHAGRGFHEMMPKIKQDVRHVVAIF